MGMRTAIVIDNPRAGNHDYGWRTAFAEGLRRRGWSVRMCSDAEPADLLVMWGTRRQDIVRRQKALGGEVCILERGYVGCRFTYTSVSFGGGLNGRGEFRTPEGVGMERFDSLGVKLTPWASARPDTYALIMGQVQGDCSIRHVDIAEWYAATARQLADAGHRDVYFRAHPGSGRRGGSGHVPGARSLGGTLGEALAGAGLVVTFNSNSGVDAVIAGRPTVAMDAGSMVWDVAGHEVTEVQRPDRTAWASRLAWCQFSKAEMESGFCAEAVGL